MCLANLFPLLYTRWFPTMDGPAHIYTANIVKEILKGNMVFKEFFFLSLLIPNLTGSLLLSLFQFAFPAWLAEKLLIAIILILLPVSFRYFVYSFTNKPTLITLAIFPFTWHFLFMIGFYNYSLGLSIALFTLGYYIRTRKAFAEKEIIFIMLMILLLAFTHLFVFVVFGIMWAVLLLGDMVLFFRKSDQKIVFKAFMKRYIKYLIAVLPGILLVGAYFIKMSHNPVSTVADRYLTVAEHLKWLLITRPLVIYFMEKEAIFGTIIAGILAIWIIASFFSTNKNTKKRKSKRILRNFLLAGALLILFFYFLFPDYKAGAGGHLSLRLLIPFYLFFLAWLSTRNLHQWLQAFGVVGFLFSSIMLWRIHLPELRHMSLEAEALVQVGERMPSGSIILPINADNHWLKLHFLNYLGAKNSMIILENTVASGDGIIRWAKPKANLSRRFGGSLMFEDTALFDDPFVHNRVDAVIIWKADKRDSRLQLFSEKLLDKFIPYDTVCAGYGWIYIHKRYQSDTLTLLKWAKPVSSQSSTLFVLNESYLVNNEFFDLIRKPLLPGYNKKHTWYRFEVSMHSDSPTTADSIYLTCMIENKKGKTVDYDVLAVQADTLIKTYQMEYHLPNKINKGDILKIYLWNPAHRNLKILSGKVVMLSEK